MIPPWTTEMRVLPHARDALVALTRDMPVPASVILQALDRMKAPDGSAALEVCRLQLALGRADESNGDSVVLIIRDGAVITVMLRRSWNQPFTPEALRVDEVASWAAL